MFRDAPPDPKDLSFPEPAPFRAPQGADEKEAEEDGTDEGRFMFPDPGRSMAMATAM